MADPHTHLIAPRRLLAATLALGFCAGPAAAEDQPQAHGTLPLEDLRAFTRVFEHIRSSYVEEVTDEELFNSAIRGMLEGLDPHSAYLDQSSYDSLQIHTSGEFGGLGIEVGMEDGFVKVISPIDDTPASRAGIEAGDLVIKIDERNIKGIALDEAVKLLRGPKGSQVTLTLLREGNTQPLEITLERDTIQVRSVRSQVLEPGFGYLRIAQFQVDTGSEVLDQLDQMQGPQPLKGLILDLRNNPGGVLQASVEVADAFLDGGEVVSTKGRAVGTATEYTAKPGDRLDGAPLVVLINGGSASASEIVAGALQDQGRALIVGTDSFGKGSVQNVIQIDEETAIKLTTARYYTPSGRSIQALGIEPDVVVERGHFEVDEKAQSTREADLDGHLQNDKKPTKTNGDEAQQRWRADNQISEALSLLKGINLYAGKRTEPAQP